MSVVTAGRGYLYVNSDFILLSVYLTQTYGEIFYHPNLLSVIVTLSCMYFKISLIISRLVTNILKEISLKFVEQKSLVYFFIFINLFKDKNLPLRHKNSKLET